MRQNHWAPVTEATYVDAILTDAADALSFAESIDPREPFDFFGQAAAPVARAGRAPVRVTAALAATLAATAAALVMAPAVAHADPVPDAPGGVYLQVVNQAPVGPRVTVTLSNGRTDVLRPCRFEDGRHCYWDGGTRGNGHGDSFVVTGGRRYMVPVL